MQLYFDHISGRQSDTDFVHILVSATFEKYEYDWALDNGWAPSNVWYDNNTHFMQDNEMIWYQSRQVRINLCKYRETKEERKLNSRFDGFSYVTTDPVFDDLFGIYREYVEARGFSDHMDRTEFERSYQNYNGQMIYIIFESNTTSDRAFSVLEVVGNSLIAHQFCWNYHTPSIYLGKVASYKEISYAREKMYKAIYIGPSYESYSIYKRSFPGFEWWTGREWSEDRSVYRKLLENDDRVRTIQDLTSFYPEYFRSLDI